MRLSAELLSKIYSKEYDCLPFARDVLLECFDKDVSSNFAKLIKHGTWSPEIIKQKFKRAAKPKSGDLVLMRPRLGRHSSHVGVYMGGQVVHLTEAGVTAQSLSALTNQFSTIRYYRHD